MCSVPRVVAMLFENTVSITDASADSMAKAEPVAPVFSVNTQDFTFKVPGPMTVTVPVEASKRSYFILRFALSFSTYVY